MSKNIKRLFDFPNHQLKEYPQENCFVYKENNIWQNISTQQYINQANTVSRALLKLGVKPHDKIAVITVNNNPKWHILDIGILQIGAQNVPLYSTLSSKDYEYILNHSDADYCFVSDDDLLDKVNLVKDKTKLKKVFSFKEFDGDSSWNSFLKLGESKDSQNEVEKIKNSINEEDLATIIYTSGTTGTPKGVMLSHKNLVQNIFMTADKLDLQSNKKRIISYLPICHIFERASNYHAQYRGYEIYFAESIEKLGDNIREVSPHLLTVVPRLLEKIFDKIVDKGSDLKGIKKSLFFWALKLGEQYRPYNKNGAFYNFKLKIARKLSLLNGKKH